MNISSVLRMLTMVLVIVGALNWGLVGGFGFNLVTAIFGATALTNIVYMLVGVSGVYQLYLFLSGGGK